MFFMTLKYLLAWESENPLPNNFQEHFPSNLKAINTFLSRLSLAHLLSEELDEEIVLNTHEDLQRLEIHNHHFLEHFPEYVVSISHTRGVAVSLIGNRKKYKSIGIDLEHAKRVMNPKVLKFFKHDTDEEQDPLLLWCKKEAAFKALSPLWNQEKTFVLKDIWIRGNEFGLLSDDKIKGQIQLEKVENDLLICLATILN